MVSKLPHILIKHLKIPVTYSAKDLLVDFCPLVSAQLLHSQALEPSATRVIKYSHADIGSVLIIELEAVKRVSDSQSIGILCVHNMRYLICEDFKENKSRSNEADRSNWIY